MTARARLAGLSDEELLRCAAAGGGEAFGCLYDRFEAPLLGFFLRATGRADVAADLTAEVFALALRSAAGFDPARGSARSWLFGIARHELADTWRRGRVEDQARRALEMETLVLGDSELDRIETELASGDAVRELLAQLPDDQRAAIEGHVLHERSYAELADALQCSAGVVRQRVSRGLRRLRARLEQSA